jgi:hypothetical protein
MNFYLFSAGIVMFALAIMHSVLGERLIFKHVRAGTPGHIAANQLLPARRWDALWSTWHLLSVLGLGLSAAMIAAAMYGEVAKAADTVAIIMAATFAIAGVYWFVGTKGKHPAWIGLLAIAALISAAI